MRLVRRARRRARAVSEPPRGAGRAEHVADCAVGLPRAAEHRGDFARAVHRLRAVLSEQHRQQHRALRLRAAWKRRGCRDRVAPGRLRHARLGRESAHSSIRPTPPSARPRQLWKDGGRHGAHLGHRRRQPTAQKAAEDLPVAVSAKDHGHVPQQPVRLARVRDHPAATVALRSTPAGTDVVRHQRPHALPPPRRQAPQRARRTTALLALGAGGILRRRLRQRKLVAQAPVHHIHARQLGSESPSTTIRLNRPVPRLHLLCV
mmetsp:Transcript_16675/g.56340  ORF Transcript_16675/g.56340 Transcript_16675/m.56340 type:complete len:262 (+) Transcript_16675:340-1125(+)